MYVAQEEVNLYLDIGRNNLSSFFCLFSCLPKTMLRKHGADDTAADGCQGFHSVASMAWMDIINVK